MYYHLVLQQIYVVNTVQKIQAFHINFQFLPTYYFFVFAKYIVVMIKVSIHSWKKPNNEGSNAIKGKNVTKKSYYMLWKKISKSWVTTKISCFYWCVSNDRNQFWLSILYDETINMQNKFIFNCSLCETEARFFFSIYLGGIQVLRHQGGGWVGSKNGNSWWFTVL